MAKQKMLVVVLFLFFISGIGFVKANQNSMPLLGKVIYLDSGHDRYSYTKTINKHVEAR